MAKRILVADDEAHILHVLSMKLRNAGYDVVTAADGEEALELCLAEAPDLVITDYQMPILSGLEFCRRMHGRDELKHVPAILLTALGFDIEPRELADAGIAVVFAKPFSPKKLLEKVNALLNVEDAAVSAERL